MRSFLRKSSSAASNSTASMDSQGPTYTNVIARRDWDRVREILADGSAKPHVPPNHDHALHFTCRFHPPVGVIKLTADVFPGTVSCPDNMGRYPLHIAAKWGASAPVMSYLVDAFPEAAGAQDAMGKTPLHLFCESYARRYSLRACDGRPLKESMLEVVKILVRAAPGCVNLEDMEDMTALEYAIDAELDRKLVRLIQKACEKDWKNRRAPGTKHYSVEKSLLEQSQQQSERLRKDLVDLTASMNLSLSSIKLEGSKCMDLERPVIAIKPGRQNLSRAFAA